MTTGSDFKRIRKTIKIFAVVQIGLMALLAFVAVNFQAKLNAIGRGRNFMQGVVAAFVIQVILFYPIYRFALKEADRDLSLIGNLSKEEVKAVGKKKRFADIVKISVFGFFVVFILAAPADPMVLSILFYSFILTILTYLQCYNFASRKLMKEQSAAKG